MPAGRVAVADAREAGGQRAARGAQRSGGRAAEADRDRRPRRLAVEFGGLDQVAGRRRRVLPVHAAVADQVLGSVARIPVAARGRRERRAAGQGAARGAVRGRQRVAVRGARVVGAAVGQRRLVDGVHREAVAGLVLREGDVGQHRVARRVGRVGRRQLPAPAGILERLAVGEAAAVGQGRRRARGPGGAVAARVGDQEAQRAGAGGRQVRIEELAEAALLLHGEPRPARRRGRGPDPGLVRREVGGGGAGRPGRGAGRRRGRRRRGEDERGGRRPPARGQDGSGGHGGPLPRSTRQEPVLGACHTGYPQIAIMSGVARARGAIRSVLVVGCSALCAMRRERAWAGRAPVAVHRALRRERGLPPGRAGAGRRGRTSGRGPALQCPARTANECSRRTLRARTWDRRSGGHRHRTASAARWRVRPLRYGARTRSGRRSRLASWTCGEA